MRVAILVVTKKGVALSQRIRKTLPDDMDCVLYVYEKYACRQGEGFRSLSGIVERIFYEYDALIFVSACGIAVRSVAPLICSKMTDPAVLVVDEGGRFVISLLSGHIGGANRLTEVVAGGIGAVPVVTTATDTGKLFSPDSFAVANGLHICEMDMAKEVAAALLNGEQVGVYSEYPCVNVPPELRVVEGEDMKGVGVGSNQVCEKPLVGICISGDESWQPFFQTLHLLPKNLILGVGCKKQISPSVFERVVLHKLEEHGLPLCRISKVASIDLKRDERAVCQFCEKYQLSFQTFSAKELMMVGGKFHHSDFVLRTTGADNVCERSAMAASDDGELIVGRQAMDGVTLAVVADAVRLDFAR